MVSQSKHARSESQARSCRSRIATLVAVSCLVSAVLFAVPGCSSKTEGEGTGGKSTEGTTAVIPHGGAAVEVHITPEAMNAKPKPWVLTSPESAVRSYLDWTSYAYRIAQSAVATPTMSTYEEVRVDSYVQYNLQRNRVIDQTLTSITVGKPSKGTTGTIVPTHEVWSYKYVSIDKAGEVIGGPYTASYDCKYTVLKNEKGDWVVHEVEAKPQGTVK